MALKAGRSALRADSPRSTYSPVSRVPGIAELLHLQDINALWSPEDGAWMADVPDLRYCSTPGDTPNQEFR
ncbi:hypothetical protein K6U06_14800 [Acidiferrimicrobium sp. IK]|uniref:type II toxin-antitoxin system HicB family antitoxin n=1 Tax=Acidiferrimicrobium sp. IK TaxID=2871700 RepID=UPI0021CB0F9E|nr:hypothetical protein [Acidiferrimicrobium sp. IK]MCU4185634.1 hypothetical protein [Acidiferrimicrobium sp. IK]